MRQAQNTFNIGVRLYQAGEFDKAEKTFRQLVRDDKRNPHAWLVLGLVNQARGNLDEAIRAYQEAARIDPKYPDAQNNLGWVYLARQQPDQAIPYLQKAIRLKANYPEAYNNLGLAYLLQKKPADAIESFRKAVRLKPSFMEASLSLAQTLITQKQAREAIDILERLRRAHPRNADIPTNLSWGLLEMGDGEKALAAATEGVRLNPKLVAAHVNVGTALIRLRRRDEGIAALQEALRLDPNSTPALQNIGLALIELRRLDEAIAVLLKAHNLEPTNPAPLNNLALALTMQGLWAEAAVAASRAAELDPDMTEALNNLGLCYIRLKEADKGIEILQRALRQRPKFPEALNNLGWALFDVGRPAEAIDPLQQALEIKPDYPDALNNLGLSLNEVGRRDEAVEAYLKAIAINPSFPEALSGLAGVYGNLGQMDEAIDYYQRALHIDPRMTVMYSNMLYTLHFHPGWTPEAIFGEHLEWAKHNVADLTEAQRPPHTNDPDPNRRIRIGYVSTDFKHHVMGFYTDLILAERNHDAFEVFCYSNIRRGDYYTERIKQKADHWRDISKLTDEQVIEMVQADQIDLLIDQGGHTSGGHRLRVFAAKPAPVQASHFGYMETTGLSTIDYRISDAVCDPPGMTENAHSEKLVRLPDVGWTYRSNVVIEVNPPPVASNGHITLGMFNAFSKVRPEGIAAWSRILHAVPGATLLTLAGVSAKADQKVMDLFAANGIGAERVTILPKQQREDYFRLFHRIDLALDTFPYAGCNTTCDSLWMGVPVVTLAGRNCMSRQGAAPLALMGLHDLITETVDDYIAAAVRLARDLPRLAELRASLRGRLESSSLGDPARFTRQLEEAYRWMWQQWCAGPGQTARLIRNGSATTWRKKS